VPDDRKIKGSKVKKSKVEGGPSVRSQGSTCHSPPVRHVTLGTPTSAGLDAVPVYEAYESRPTHLELARGL
jgi:hypothetical protein